MIEKLEDEQDYLTTIKALIESGDKLQITDLLESLQPVERTST